MRRLLLVPTTLALAGAALAQTFPPVPKWGSTVFDGADLLTPNQEQAISSLSRDFQRDTGAPIAVATLSSLDRYEAKGLGIQKYSTALFNEWRVGAKKTNGGILLVVAKEDRKVWVALGSDWGHEFDAKTQGIVRGTITPFFKKGQFGEGIVQGCQALVHLVDAPAGAGSQGPAGPPVPSAPSGAVPSDAMPSQGGDASAFFGGGILCLALPVLLFVVIVAATRRRRSYRPHGGSFGPGSGPNVYNRYDDPRDDSGDFLTGVIVGQAMSQPPPIYDPNPFDNGPSYDSSPSFDSGSSDSGISDSGSSDSGGGFDSGSSDGGGVGGDW